MQYTLGQQRNDKINDIIINKTYHLSSLHQSIYERMTLQVKTQLMTGLFYHLLLSDIDLNVMNKY